MDNYRYKTTNGSTCSSGVTRFDNCGGGVNIITFVFRDRTFKNS